MKRSVWYQNESFLFITAGLLSLILSLWISSSQSIINPDAICYLLSAQTFSEHGLKAAMNLCGQAKWPFYSMLIAGTAYLSDLSYMTSAYCLDGLFSLLTVTMFILIVKELGGSLRIMWFAALVILLSHQFNSIREYIIRDHGFWALYLSSVWLLLLFFRQSRWWLGLFWNASILVASLFRIEGMVFLIFVPFLTFLFPHFSLRKRVRLFVSLNTINLILLATFFGIALLRFQQLPTDWGRLVDFTVQFQKGMMLITYQFQQIKIKLLNSIVDHSSMIDTGWLVLILLAGWYLISIILNLSWIYSALAIYAFRRRIAYFSLSARLVLFGYISLNMIITLTFLLEHLFLSKRYLIALTLLLTLWVPFALNYLYDRVDKFRYQFAFVIAIALIFFSSLGGIFDFGYSKAYIAQAGSWIEKNVPKQAALYANDYQLMYYANHYGEHIFDQADYLRRNILSNQGWQQFDYLALRINKKNANHYAEITQQQAITPIAIFNNKRGDQIRIFKVDRNNKEE